MNINSVQPGSTLAQHAQPPRRDLHGARTLNTDSGFSGGAKSNYPYFKFLIISVQSLAFLGVCLCLVGRDFQSVFGSQKSLCRKCSLSDIDFCLAHKNSPQIMNLP